jgi:hypothetical protein
MKSAAIRYAEILEAGAWVTHQEQDEIAKLLRGLVMTEDEAWDEMEARQNKPKKELQPNKIWIGLDNADLQYQTPHDVIVMRYAEAILKEKNK